MLPANPELQSTCDARAEFRQAIAQLRGWFAGGMLDVLQPCSANTVYTSSVTMWMLISQRLGAGKTLDASVKDLIAGAKDLLPDNKRVRETTLSENTSSFSDARKRLSLATVRYFYDQISYSIVRNTPRVHRGRRLFLLDGTTLTLAPTSELRGKYPPATNQHGESVWPVMMVFVAHEMETGCALFPQVGAMYGNKNESELKMARRTVAELPEHSVVIADAGLGIFGVAHGATEAGHDFILRLTKQRFESHVKKAEWVDADATGRTWRFRWTPSAKERKSVPSLPQHAAMTVKIHELVNGDEPIYLITSLPDDRRVMGEYYRRRNDVETDIREIKVAMRTEQIRAKSEAMVLKEFYTSLIAYNLVVQFRRQAAQLVAIEPRRLSFQGVWNTYESFLLYDLSVLQSDECFDRFEQALRVASRARIRHRPGRNYQRAAHPRRPKTTKWQKSQRQKKAPDSKVESIKENTS